MADNYWFTKVIPSCVACSGVVFGVIQFMQVTPLQIDLAKLQATIVNKKSLIKTTKEFQSLYFQEKTKREFLDEKLKYSARLEVEKKNLEIELTSKSKRLKELDKFSNYEAVELKLSDTESSLSEYKRAYSSLLTENEKLKSHLSLKSELVELNKNKKHLETILDCMNQGCGNFLYLKYSKKNDPVAFEQYKHQLDETNRQISLLYSALAQN